VVPNGLDRTLFDRLVELGHQPIPLFTQYRVSFLSFFFLFIAQFQSNSTIKNTII